MKAKEKIELGTTGYYIGEMHLKTKQGKNHLEIYMPNEEEKQNKIFVFDENSGNAHFYPEDLKLAKELSNEIDNKRKEIHKALEQKIKKRNFTTYILPKLRNNTAIKCTKGTQYYEADSYLRFIRIKCNNRKYDLVFCRFYRNDEKKTINCILNELQFEYTRNEKSYSIYPTSDKNGAKTYEEINKKKGYYYNPKVSLLDNPDDIADEFLDFITKSENEFEKSF